MATIQEIERAIRAAHRDGRTDAVKRLGAEYKRLKSENPSGQVFENTDPMLQGWRGEGSEQFQERPWYEQAGIAADDSLRLLSNGLTFGYRDKLAEYMGGSDPETERAKSGKAMERAGFPGQIAEAAGMSMLPGGPLRKMEQMALEGAGGLRSIFTKGATAATEGSLMGALHASGHDTDIQEGALSGALVGPLARFGVGGVTKGLDKAAGLATKRPPRMTIDDVPTVTRTATGRGMVGAPAGGNTFVAEDYVNELARRVGNRRNWDTKIGQAERRTKTSRGGSVDLNIRKTAEKEVEKAEAGKGSYAPAELEALEKAATGKGSPGHNFATKMSALAPASNPFFSGMGGMLGGGIGYAANSPTLGIGLGLALPAVGQGAKIAANALSRRNAADIGDQFIRGSTRPNPKNAVQETLGETEQNWEKFLRAWSIAGEERKKRH